MLHSRENALADKYRELQEKEDEDRRLTEELRKLQRRVAEEVPAMEADRNQKMEQITREWEKEMDNLEWTRQYERNRSMELHWHVNRGSHIRPIKKDPREKKGLFGKEDVHENDRRLKGEEERLLIEHQRKSALLEDQMAEKVLVNRRREAIAAQWDAKPLSRKDGGRDHPPHEGTKLWYDMEIARLKQRCAAEEKELKSLVDANHELKAARRETETRKKEITRGLNEQLVKQQRNAVACRKVPQITDRPAAAGSPPGRRTGGKVAKRRDPAIKD